MGFEPKKNPLLVCAPMPSNVIFLVFPRGHGLGRVCMSMYVEVEVTLRLTVIQSVCLGIEYPCGTCDQILFPVGMLLSEICGLVSVGSPLWREDGSVCTQLAPRLTRLSPIASDKYNWFCRLCFRLPAALLYVSFHCLSLNVSAYMAMFRCVGYFMFICLKDSASQLFFVHGYTLHVFHLWGGLNMRYYLLFMLFLVLLYVC
jgi:hypothetical protein